MNKALLSLSLVLSLFLVSATANAALIVNNSTSVSALSLSEDFESFYDYGGNVKAGSNTGYEMSDSLVLLLVSYNGQYGLVGLMDTADGTSGGIQIDLTDTSDVMGAFTLYDDPKESGVTSGNTTSSTWYWGNDFTDGFVYTFGDISDIDVTLDFTVKAGISQIVFYDFTGTPQVLDVTGSSLTITGSIVPDTTVSEPNVMFLGLFSLLLVVARARKLK